MALQDFYKKHEKITAIVKESIESFPVVFPATYGKLYSETARKYDVKLKPEELLDSEILDEKIVRHVITLGLCTDQAIEAIQNEDISLLKLVLEKTNILRDEIHELQKLVYEDGLTKSYNRKWLEDMYLAQNKEEGTIVVIDLNKFKSINDTYGHIVGDKVLIHVAKKLKESGGKVVRYGGDEFLVIFGAHESPAKIQKIIEAMIQKCENTSFKASDGSFKIGFSYGIAPFRLNSDFNTVIDTADKAMYRQKRGDTL